MMPVRKASNDEEILSCASQERFHDFEGSEFLGSFWPADFRLKYYAVPMKNTVIVLSLFVLVAVLMSYRAAAQTVEPVLNKDQARSLSDSFIDDLVKNRVSRAIEKFWSYDVLGRKKSRSFINASLKRCGKPLNARAEKDGVPVVGESISPDGHKQPTMTFLYLCTTSHGAKYRFDVEIELGNKGRYIVGGFGCGPLHPPK